MAGLSEIDSLLQSMLAGKPPGVSGSKIGRITDLAVQNVQDNARVVSQIYTHFKKAPGSHKLGALYVVDSIARTWQDMARKSGQDLKHPRDASFSGGLKRIMECIESLMNDITQSAPPDQMDRIRKLVDIWEKAGTFPPDVLANIRRKHFAPPQSTTPPGPPPAAASAPVVGGAKPDTASILAALANIAKQPSSSTPPAAGIASPQAPAPAQVPAMAMAPAPAQSPLAAIQSVLGRNASPQPQQQPAAQAFGMPMMANPMPQPTTQSPPNALAGSGGSLGPQQIQLIQLLVAQGVPADKIQTIVASTMAANQAVPPPGQLPIQPSILPQATSSGALDTDWSGRDRRRRSRSRSRSPPGRARSPRGSGGGGGRRGRSRSPPPRGGSNPMQQPGVVSDLKNTEPRFYQHDASIPPGNIRVYSRTLFVGGVTETIDEQLLRELYGRFGPVQSIIIGHGQRHAFVKLHRRRDAETARKAMEAYPINDTVLRTKWGVGYGPRDCSDYTVGISTIPLHSLTDADRRWMVTAEWGGTGGKPLEAGIVVEEPDIEIGSGVSSKAMSKRTGRGGASARGFPPGGDAPPPPSITDLARQFGQDGMGASSMGAPQNLLYGSGGGHGGAGGPVGGPPLPPWQR